MTIMPLEEIVRKFELYWNYEYTRKTIRRCGYR